MSNEENLNEIETEKTVSQETSETAEPVAPQVDEAGATDKVDAAREAEQTETTEQVEPDSGVSATENATENVAESESAPKAERKSAKAKDKPANGKRGMSKMFKLVYYPVLALVAVVMLVFSVIDGVYGYSPSAYDDDYYAAVNAHITELSSHPRSGMSPSVDQNGEIGIVAARNYIVDKLVAGGFTSVAENKPEEAEDGESIVTITDWGMSQAGTFVPTVTLHTATPSIELQNTMGVDEYLAGYQLTNIIAAIPCGKNDADSVVVTVRYDSRPDTVGAADNAAFVANVLQSLIEYVKNGVKFETIL